MCPNYVTEGSALNREVSIGSYYGADQVPMRCLKAIFQNGICSLNPNVDRLTSQPLWKLLQGKAVNHRIKSIVINTTFRMIPVMSMRCWLKSRKD